jgi:hypothetical protein
MATTLLVAADLQAALPDIPPSTLAALPSVLTGAVERYCGRPLALAAFDEEHTPGTTRLIRLKGRPVISVDRLLADLSIALTIQHAAGPWRATVSLAIGPAGPTALVLATEASSATLSFAPTSGPALPTIAALAAAVNALSGWTAVVAPLMGPCPTSEVRPTRATFDALKLPAAIQAYASTLGDYELVPETGKVTLRQIRPDPYAYPTRTFGVAGYASLVRALYSAGYNGDPAQGAVTTPPDLAEACLEVARGMFDTRQVSGAFTMVLLGNTQYYMGKPVPIPPGAQMLLEPYVDRRPV